MRQKPGTKQSHGEKFVKDIRRATRKQYSAEEKIRIGRAAGMAYKRLEESSFTWPAISDGVMTLNRAQFEALFAGLDWRRVRSLEARRPAAAE